MPQRTCPVKCTCDLSRYIEKSKEHDFIMRFLAGLNEGFAPCKSQILMMDQIPSVDRVFSMVIQYERQNNLSPENDDDQAVVNAVDGRRSYGRGCGNYSNKVCTHCGKIGHTIETCYKKIGYPPGFKFRNNNTSSENCVAGDDATDSKSTQDQATATISQEEYKALMSLLCSNTATGGSDSQTGQSSSQACSIIRSPPNEGNPATCCSINSLVDDWIIDSGASDHICSSLNWFHSYKKIQPISIRLPNGTNISAEYVGDVCLTESITLHGVLYLPMFAFNLISISRLTKPLNCCFSFFGESCLIQDSSKKTIGSGKMIDGLYRLTQDCSSPPHVDVRFCNSVSVSPSALWHFRLGHASQSKLESLCKQLPYVSFNKVAICDVCHFAKQKKLPFSVSSHRAAHQFDLLHMDLWGPFSIASVHNHKYFLTIVDDFSRFTWIVMLKGKFEARDQIQKFILLVETQFGATVKMIRSDNGPKFNLSSFYASKGIVHQCSCVETPQQNGRVERKHQHILNVARALLFQACLPKKF